MTDRRRDPLPSSDQAWVTPEYSDLLARPFDRERWNCWHLVREMFSRAGVPLSSDFTDRWQRTERGHPGCVVAMQSPDGLPHVGYVLRAGRMIHCSRSAGVCVEDIPEAEVTGYFVHAGRARLAGMAHADPTRVAVVWVPDPMSPADRIITYSEPGLTVAALAPSGATAVIHGGEIVTLATAGARVMRAGEWVTFVRAPGETATLISLAIGLFLSAVSFVLSPSIPKPKERDEPATPTFDLAGLRNTFAVGAAQPVLYGEHRGAGPVLSAFLRADSSGRSILHALIMVSRGPIHSIGGIETDTDDLVGVALPDSFQIDGTAAREYDARVSIRLGGTNQEPIPGFDQSVSAVSYSKTLLLNDPFTHVTAGEIDGFDVLLTYPNGLYNINGSGDVGQRTVSYTMRWRRLGTTTWTTQNVAHDGARRGTFTRQFSKYGLTRDRYEIQIERTQPPWPETQADKESRSDLVAVNEVTSDAFARPGKALVAFVVSGSDQLSGGFPTFTWEAKGRKVWVWDGVSTTSPDFGTAETWTDSPAWCLLDAIINPQYGLRRSGRLTLDNIHLQSFYDWAADCATLVDDGRGGTVARATLNTIVDTTNASGWELLQSFARSHYGELMIVGNKIRVHSTHAFIPGAAYSITAGNATDVRIARLGRRQRPNAVTAQFFNAEADWNQETTAPVIDDTSVITGAEPLALEEIQAPGVTLPSQVYRYATYRRNAHRDNVEQFEFVGGVETIHLIPGDVIYFHSDVGVAGASGRALAATSNSITLDRAITATTRVLIRVKHADDSQESRFIAAGTYARGSAIPIVDGSGVATTWTITPDAGCPWTIGSLTAGSTLPDIIQIRNITTLPDFRREFSAITYDVDTTSDDPGEVEEFTDTLPDPRKMPSVPTDLRVDESAIESSDGSVLDAVFAEWTPSEAWSTADVWYRRDDETLWRFASRSGTGRATIGPLAGSTAYEVSVTPVAKGATRVRPDAGARKFVYVHGRRSPPDSPSAMTVSVTGGVLSAVVTKVSDPFVAGYQFRYGETWAGSAALAECEGNVLSMACPFAGKVNIRCRTISRYGVLSWSEVTAEANHVLDEATRTADVNNDEHAGFAGTKTNTAVTGSELQLSGSNITGTYQTPDRTPYLDGFRQVVLVRAECDLADVALTWDDCAFRFDSGRAGATTWATAVLDGREVEDGLTWDDSGFTWDSVPGFTLTWAGPTSIIDALAPTIEIDTNEGSGFSGSWRTFRVPYEAAITGARARVTLRRPHTRYDPRIVELNLTTALVGGNETERFSIYYTAGTATAAGSRSVGFGSTASANAQMIVPTSKVLTVLEAEIVVTTDAAAGTYTCDLIVRNTTDTSDVVVVTVTSSSINTRVHGRSEGTRVAPLATLAASKEYQIGWLNRATSPGALKNTNHVVRLVCIYEDA